VQRNQFQHSELDEFDLEIMNSSITILEKHGCPKRFAPCNFFVFPMLLKFYVTTSHLYFFLSKFRDPARLRTHECLKDRICERTLLVTTQTRARTGKTLDSTNRIRRTKLNMLRISQCTFPQKYVRTYVWPLLYKRDVANPENTTFFEWAKFC